MSFQQRRSQRIQNPLANPAPVSGDTSISPGGGSLLLTGAAAIMALGMVAAGASLSLTGGTPSLVVGTVIAPTAATLTLTGNAPIQDLGLPATKASLVLSGSTPVQSLGISPSAGSLTLSGGAPIQGLGLPASGAVLVLTGSQPAINGVTQFNPTGGALILTGGSPVQDLGLPAGKASLTLSGGTPTLIMGTVLQPSSGTLTLSGSTPILDTGLLPAKATLVLTGNQPGVFVGVTVIPGTGALTLSGTTPIQGLGMPAGGATLSLVGGTPALVVSTLRSPAGASLILAGSTPIQGLGLPVGAASLTLSGGTPTLLSPVQFNPVGGALVLSGSSPQLVIGSVRSPSGASLNLSGGQPTRIDLAIYPGSGSLVLVGGPASFNAGVTGTQLIPIGAEVHTVIIVDDSFVPLNFNYPQTILMDGVRYYYRLDDSGLTVVDSGPGAHNLAIANGGTGVVEGQPGAVPGNSAMQFLGNGFIQGATSLTGLTSFSMEMWVNLAGLNQLATVLTLAPGKQTGIDILSGGQINVRFIVGNITFSFASVGTIGLSGYQHIVMSWTSGSVAKLYINGVFDTDSGSPLTGSLNTYSSLTLATSTSLSNWLTGFLDEVAVYPVALTADQVANHFQQFTRWYFRAVPIAAEVHTVVVPART